VIAGKLIEDSSTVQMTIREQAAGSIGVVTAPRRMSREGRRAFLLDTAAELVDREGAGALTFEALADAAGVTKTLPYAYFESRDEVLLVLFERVIGALDAEIEAVLQSEASFEDIVRSSLGIWFDAVRDHGRLVGALLDARSVAGLAAAIRRRDRASHKLWHDLVVERFELHDRDAHLLAAMLNSTATATVWLWTSRRGTREALIDGFVVMATGAAMALHDRPPA
jgi:AcrR family transcriptional regulator